jgi:Flp pilus assembly secretin CpaC
MKMRKETCRNRSRGNNKNYFAAAAAWIANFGVVPLFLLAAFLFEPAFFFFLNLLLFVTHVLETIRQLLFSYNDELQLNCRRFNYKFITAQYSDFKPSFVPIFNNCVKEIMGFVMFILLLGASISPTFAGGDHILAKGESFSLKLPQMKKFNIGNKEVLNYRFDEKNKQLIIRGIRLGHTEILVWNDSAGVPDKHQIFVISKIQEAKYLHLAELLGSLGIETELHLPHLRATGMIQTIGQYMHYKQIEEKNPDIILDSTTLNPELKTLIIGDIYKNFFNDFKENIRCEVEFSDILCTYPVNDAPSESLKKQLIAKYKVRFQERNDQRLTKNYSFKLRLIQLEQLDGEELRLGLEQLSATLGDLLNLPLRTVVEKNSVLLAQKKVKMNTLAEPSGLIRPLSPAEFQIGADVPFQSVNNSGTVSTTQWQFAGLKIKIVLENLGDKIKIDYETELTKPDVSGTSTQVSISGNKEKSSIVLQLDKATQMFQVSLKTDAQSVDQMPFLNRIPLLGELFKSKSEQNNFKLITGIIEVSEHE